MKNLDKIIFIGIFLLISKFNIAQSLSPYSEISVLTCAPGNELYSTFGHSAIRIKDPVLRIDNVYNYGTFNFETPGFYLKFIRGKLDYMLSVSPYRYFVMSYKQERRAVSEQVLDLSYSQKNAIYKALLINTLPENVYYRYDFLKDNCATRVLKIINEAISDSIILPSKLDLKKKTYREMLMPYLKGNNWERFGINLALGRPADKVVTIEESAFLPDYLKTVFDNTSVNTKNGLIPIVKRNNILFSPVAKSESEKPLITPQRIFWLLLVIILFVSIIEINKKKNYLILDKTLFFIFGFIGLNILFLWFGTNHSAVINNQNIIWASPLFFIAAFLLHKKNKKYLKIFFLLSSILVLFGLISDSFFINLFDKASAPLELIIIVRSALIWFKN